MYSNQGTSVANHNRTCGPGANPLKSMNHNHHKERETFQHQWFQHPPQSYRQNMNEMEKLEPQINRLNINYVAHQQSNPQGNGRGSTN